MTVLDAYSNRRYALANRWNPRNLTAVLELVGPQPGDLVLDVGCGRGHVVAALRRLGVDARGVDGNPKACEVAVTDEVATMEAEHLGFADQTFDSVVSFHTIEHVPQVAQALGEMARVVKPGGRVLLIYPAEPIRGLYAVPTAVILYRNPLKARRVHVHKLSPTKVTGLAAGVGLRHQASRFRIWPTPEWVSLFSKS